MEQRQIGVKGKERGERKEVKGKANAAVKREMCKVVSLPQGHTVHV